MKTNFMPTESHKLNAKLAKQGKKAAAPKWKAKRWQVRLEQTENEEWLVFINGSKHGFPASDVEVSLWLELEEMKKAISSQTDDLLPAGVQATDCPYGKSTPNSSQTGEEI